MRRRLAAIIASAVAVALTTSACGSDVVGPAGGPPDQVVITLPGLPSDITLPGGETIPLEITIPLDEGPGPGGDQGDQVAGPQPQVPLPPGFPVFPGAEFSFDMPYDPANYGYFFISDAPRPEVCEFYLEALYGLIDHGFEVTEAYEGTELGRCNPREIVVEARLDGTTMITILSTEGDDIGFWVSVNHQEWQPGWLAP